MRPSRGEQPVVLASPPPASTGIASFPPDHRCDEGGTGLRFLSANSNRKFAMPIPTEPIGSIPRPLALIDAVRKFRSGRLDQRDLDAVYADALSDTIRRFEETGSPVITDGEQTKPSLTGPVEHRSHGEKLIKRQLAVENV